MIRVLLAEDQAMVRGALSALLSREQDIEVVAEVARGDEVVKAASERCSPPHSSEPAWQKSQHDCLSQRGLCAIIFLSLCRNWAHRIGWKLHGSLSKRGGYDKE